MKTVAITGHFDPIHVGHVRHIQAASKLGTLIVIVNPDEHCITKKGYCFMPYKERSEIIGSIRGVDSVVLNIDNDGTTAKSLEWYKPDIFAKGGDRTEESMPKNELEVCRDLGIEIVYNVGGEKIQSSSKLVERSR